jgi:uncharacterized protein YndB with AHSA1/START domain
MLKIIGIIAVVAFVLPAGLLIYAATRPDSFRVQRSIVIAAPPEKIFGLIADFARWPDWSPYETKDPAMRREMSAVTAGRGATYAWAGNSQVGEGRMEIVEAQTPALIRIKLDFLKPFEAHNTATFTLEPRGAETEVTWAMDGPSPFITKVMGVICDLDKMIGADFAAGLANLKRRAES